MSCWKPFPPPLPFPTHPHPFLHILFLSEDGIDVRFDRREFAQGAEQVLGLCRAVGSSHHQSLMCWVTLAELFPCVLLLPSFFLVDTFEGWAKGSSFLCTKIFLECGEEENVTSLWTAKKNLCLLCKGESCTALQMALQMGVCLLSSPRPRVAHNPG